MKSTVFLSVVLVFVMGFAHGAAGEQKAKTVQLYSVLSQLADTELECLRLHYIDQLAPTIKGWMLGLDLTRDSFKDGNMPANTRKTFHQKLDETSKFLYYMLPVKGRVFDRQDVQRFQACSEPVAKNLVKRMNEMRLACNAGDKHDEEFFQKSELSHSFE